MKMATKRLAAMLLALSMFTGLVACGGGGSEAPAPAADGDTGTATADEGGSTEPAANTGDGIVLSVAFNMETSDDAYETDMVPLFEAFMELHPEVSGFEFTGMGKMTEDTQVTRLTGGQYEDVLLLPMTVPVNELPNYFEPVGDATELGEKYFYGDYLQSGGQTYGLPIGVVYEGLLYNQAVLDECYGGKVPQTLDELWEACEAINAAGKTAFYTNAGAEWPLRFWDNLAITASEDPNYANTILDKTAPWAEDEALYFSTNLLSEFAANGMIEPDTVTEQWDNSRISVAMGETAFMLIGTWAIPQIKLVAEEMGENPDNISFAPFPYKNDVSSSNKVYMRVSEDLFMGVNKNSEHKELAMEFLVFFCENISLARGMNQIMRDGGENVEDLQFLQELDYIEYYSSPAKDPRIAEVAGGAKIDVYSIGSYLQDYVIQPTLSGGEPRFDELNELWGAALG